MTHSRSFMLRNGSSILRSGDIIPETPKVSLPVSPSEREGQKPEVSTCAQEHIEAPVPPLQPRSTCERLESPFL